MAVKEPWDVLLKLMADNEELLGTAAHLETVVKFFTNAHYMSPGDVVGARSEDFVEGEECVKWPSGPPKPCIRRIMDFINELYVMRKDKASKEARRMTSPPPERRSADATSPSAAGGGSPYTKDQETRLRLLGMDPTVMAATAAMKEGKMIEPLELLKARNFGPLAFTHVVPKSVFTLMMADTEEANREGRQFFFFIDFLSKEMLPVWLSPESVGGKKKSLCYTKL